MARMSLEQRELCRLLSPLHERFCGKHRAPSPEGHEAECDDDTTPAFSLSEFRAALDDVWDAAKALDRSLRARRNMNAGYTIHESGTLPVDLAKLEPQNEPKQGRA